MRAKSQEGQSSEAGLLTSWPTLANLRVWPAGALGHWSRPGCHYTASLPSPSATAPDRAGARARAAELLLAGLRIERRARCKDVQPTWAPTIHENLHCVNHPPSASRPPLGCAGPSSARIVSPRCALVSCRCKTLVPWSSDSAYLPRYQVMHQQAHQRRPVWGSGVPRPHYGRCSGQWPARYLGRNQPQAPACSVRVSSRSARYSPRPPTWRRLTCTAHPREGCMGTEGGILSTRPARPGPTDGLRAWQRTCFLHGSRRKY